MGATTDAFLLWIGIYNAIGCLGMIAMLLNEGFADDFFRKHVVARSP